MVAIIAWIDLHAQALTSMGSFGAMIAALGSWFCTVWGDRRAAARSQKNADAIAGTHSDVQEIRISINSRMDQLIEQKGIASKSEGVAEERAREK